MCDGHKIIEDILVMPQHVAGTAVYFKTIDIIVS